MQVPSYSLLPPSHPSLAPSLSLPPPLPPSQVPDSPDTLFKLLKVLPRKTTRKSSVVGSSRTSGVYKAKKTNYTISKKG